MREQAKDLKRALEETDEQLKKAAAGGSVGGLAQMALVRAVQRACVEAGTPLSQEQAQWAVQRGGTEATSVEIALSQPAARLAHAVLSGTPPHSNSPIRLSVAAVLPSLHPSA